MSKLLKRPSPAMVVTCLSLFVASTGTSIAARHYLITSTKQIKPSVLIKLRGAKGLKGLRGFTGAIGATGATGATGAQGPSGIVTTGVFATAVSNLAGSSPAYVFAGGTATVTTTASQRLTGAAGVLLGSSTSAGGQLFDYGLCLQPSVGGVLVNFMGADYASGVVYPDSRTFAAAASVAPGAGTWKVGFCVRNGYGSNAIDNNHWVNGWVQVTD